jgi:hypothetical protein
MYQDSVLNYPSFSLDDGFDDKPFFSSTVNPGTTFIRLLRALTNVDPAKDHNVDLLRMYDDLCKEIGAPLRQEMLEIGVASIENRLKVLSKSGLGHVYRYYLQSMALRNEYPLFFVNDLIYSDKCDEMDKRIGHVLRLSFPRQRGILVGEEISMSMDTTAAFAADIVYQMLWSDQIGCPFERVFGFPCRRGLNCENVFPGDGISIADENCTYYHLIEKIWRNGVPVG